MVECELGLSVTYELNSSCNCVNMLINFMPIRNNFTHSSDCLRQSNFQKWRAFCIFALTWPIAAAQLDLPPIQDDGYNNINQHRDLDYRNILARLEFLGAERCSANVASQWNYETNVNDYNQLEAVSASC